MAPDDIRRDEDAPERPETPRVQDQVPLCTGCPACEALEFPRWFRTDEEQERFILRHLHMMLKFKNGVP